MFWLKVVAAIVGFIIAVLLLRKLLEINKVVVIVVGVISLSVLWFQWIYERNEPAFMTPIIEPMAQFFPSKGSYGNKQAEEPGKPGLNKKAKPSAPAKH